MDVLFFAYAHSSQSPMPALQAEDDSVYGLLTPRALQQHYLIHRDAYTSRQKIREFLILYRDNIALFSYSGHADGKQLLLGDEASRSGGLARLLGQCPNLKVVILNGCSTRGQVEQLQAAGVPVVIATSTVVGDQSAKDFAVGFHQALSTGSTLEQAFELGLGATELGQAVHTVERGLDLRSGNQPPEDPIWGIYYQQLSELEWMLPVKADRPPLPDFTPNSVLVRTLIAALEDYSEELEMLKFRQQKGKTVRPAHYRIAILNCLPAPIAEHLRKLIAPMRGSKEGYDRAGIPRLKQLVRTYGVIVEVMAFTLLAQLWEALLTEETLHLPPEPAKAIHALFARTALEAADYDYMELIRSIRQIFDTPENEGRVAYFVPELEALKELPYQNEGFMAANFFLKTLQQRIYRGAIVEQETGTLCQRAEESLAEVLKHLGFLAEYTLASISNIDIEKYRHLRVPTFRHNIVRLIDLLGGLDQTNLVLKRFTDNRSILLIKESGSEASLRELNLSPFIIDKNAFEEDAEEVEVTNIYFFSHYNREKDAYYFYRVYNPEESPLLISSLHFPVVKEQLDAFVQLFAPPRRTNLPS